MHNGKWRILSLQNFTYTKGLYLIYFCLNSIHSCLNSSANAGKCYIKSPECHSDIWNISSNRRSANKNILLLYVLKPDSDASRLDLDSVTCTGATNSSDNELQSMHFSCIIDHWFTYFVSCSVQADDAHEAWQDRAEIQAHTDIHRSTLPGRALVKWLDIL